MNDDSRQRTLQQNKSLHLYCEMVAEALNDAGFDMRRTLKHDVEIPWTKDTVKDYLWRPIQEALLQKESTTELDTAEPSKVYEILSRHLAQKLGISVVWPDRFSQAERHTKENAA